MAVEAQRPADTHFSEEAAENYAVGRLPKAQLAAFEEHLLLCERCRKRLNEEDEFAAAMWSSDGTAEAAPISAIPTAPSLPPASDSASQRSSSALRRGGLREFGVRVSK